MFKNLKITAGVITTLAVLSPIATIVSCGSGLSQEHNDYSFKDYSFKDIDWEKVSYKDATIVSWIDGDTPIVNLEGGTSSIADEKDMHVRVSSIDTPELHVAGDDGKINVITTGSEFEWAEKGRVFGNTEMPAGSKIRIYTIGSLSYGRLVGSIFYGDNYSKLYSTEVLKKGLAYPFISSALEAHNVDSIEHFSYRSIADAYNYAKNNKIGIYSQPEGEVSKIHGSTNVVPVTDFGSDEENERKRTVYYYTKDL